MRSASFWTTVALLAAAAAAVMPAAAQKPNDSPPSYLFFAKESKSPLITPAYPLHRAVGYWDLAGVKAAVEQGKADVNQGVPHKMHSNDKAPTVYTPLRVAFESTEKCGASCESYPEPVKDIAYYLLCSGAKPNQDSRNDLTALMSAAYNGSPELVFALLASGANPNAVNLDKNTALHASECTYKETPDAAAALSSALLLAFGANPKAQNKNGKTPLEAQRWIPNGKCVKPGKDTETTCYATCKVLTEGITPGEAADLKAGKLPNSLAVKLGLEADVVKRASADLAKAAAALKACPAAAKRG